MSRASNFVDLYNEVSTRRYGPLLFSCSETRVSEVQFQHLELVTHSLRFLTAFAVIVADPNVPIPVSALGTGIWNWVICFNSGLFLPL